jgi:hypothetical protein
MRYARIAVAALAALALYISPLAAQDAQTGQADQAGPTISEKKDLAIFAMGFYGFNIPYQALGSTDQAIRKVFVDLGRFNIISVSQKLSSKGLDAFIDAIKKSKQANFKMPDKYEFGEAILTEEEFNKLLGAFIVAVPVVSEYNTAFNDATNAWETNLKVDVSFIDVSQGSIIGVAEVKAFGSDPSNNQKSVSAAIDQIPMQLQYEIRKIEAFQISTRVLAVSGSEIKLQMGRNMGIKKGDEYSIVVHETVEGFKNDTEHGLVQIKDVGSEVSTGRIVYASIPVTKDVQLQEIPRLGVDAEGYFHYLTLLGGNVPVPGVRFAASRGFYGFRPYAAVQVPLGDITPNWGFFSVIPISVIVGGEYNAYLRRLTLTAFGGVGGTYAHLLNSGEDSTSDWLSHLGAQGYVRASFLFTRELSVFAEAGAEYWISAYSDIFDSFGGVGIGGGVQYKL